MDVKDYSINEATRFHRRHNRLTNKAQIRVTPQDKGWSTFSKMHYYETAAKMIPDKEIDRIIVEQREKETYGTDFQAVTIETLRFSFRSPSQDGDTNVDPVGARAAKLIAEDDLEAVAEIVENAAVAHEKAILEGETEGFPDTSLDN
ncbi:hypothetical protein Cpir12675_004698 [Ceratocystis pirilliformis]|uniref:Uncharacterized protein n=1 Tax=Ceratocystis pirilliformis TaxID=259994 RepID=A0ABR3YVY4_9PEZI